MNILFIYTAEGVLFMNSIPLTSNNITLFVISILLVIILFFGIDTEKAKKLAGGVVEVPA
jgi:hypothetical protein